MAHLPMTRIRTIMHTTDGADAVSKEAVFVTARAAELFIKEISLAAFKNRPANDKHLKYSNLVQVVHTNDKYEFLEYMIPKKITVKEYKEMMRKKAAGISDSSDDASSSTGSGSESTSEDAAA